MKYFKHLFDRAAEALVGIFHDGRHADKAIEYYFKNNKKWGKRDRQFFAETVYGCVRWWNKYLYLSEAQGDEPLRQAHKAIAVHLILADQLLPEWYQGLVDEAAVVRRERELPAGALKEAFPEWLYARAEAELGGDVWRRAASELNRPAKVVLRANTLKTGRDELRKALAGLDIDAAPLSDAGVPDALVLRQRANVFSTELFKSGLFEVQDGSSQLVAGFLAPKPGERVVDACAGAGGKSLHLAALMQNKGKVVALDVVAWKLDELKKRARRAGVSIIEARLIDSTKVIKRLYASADAVLLDVPCSGLGVLKRNPDSKWKLTPEAIEKLEKEQRDILAGYSPIVKPGGRMVYSTCSVLPSENQKQVDAFLSNHPEWRKTAEKIVLPNDEGFDGFYMARLERQA